MKEQTAQVKDKTVKEPHSKTRKVLPWTQKDGELELNSALPSCLFHFRAAWRLHGPAGEQQPALGSHTS